jgi:hypothetical protein
MELDPAQLHEIRAVGRARQKILTFLSSAWFAVQSLLLRINSRRSEGERPHLTRGCAIFVPT